MSGDQYKGQRSISHLIVRCHNSPPPLTKPYQRWRVGGRDRRRYEDVRGSMRRCWRREEVQESQGPRVLRSRDPKVPGSQGPRYLKLKFKYELDSKEGPSCFSTVSLAPSYPVIQFLILFLHFQIFKFNYIWHYQLVFFVFFIHDADFYCQARVQVRSRSGQVQVRSRSGLGWVQVGSRSGPRQVQVGSRSAPCEL